MQAATLAALDGVKLCNSARPSVEAEAFSKHILDIHDEIRRRIVISNEKYKSHVDLKRKFTEFEEGYEVMVRICPERYPKGIYKKLHSRSAGPFKILKKISSNAYILELPEDMGISNIFNIEGLTSYIQRLIDPRKNFPSTYYSLARELYDVPDHQLVSTRSGGYQKHLIHWKGHPRNNCTWITDAEFRQIDPDFYESVNNISFSNVAGQDGSESSDNDGF
ncbi:hypothetical protein ACH5RR_006719 [Cinchona calisaya]|uniref:Tf2-1-like SH3-like domain-containing protein n=1 Tax=Cinchona calisaya TaxID=153742 RepID=A0ABD3APS5_9GENT